MVVDTALVVTAEGTAGDGPKVVPHEDVLLCADSFPEASMAETR